MSETLEIKRLIEEQGRTWESFRAANDERLKQIEARGSADTVLTQQVETANAAITEAGEKIKALQARLDEAELQANRRALGSDGQMTSPEARAHRAAFQSFVRKGEEAGLRELEVKAAINTGTDADGGYAVPQEIDQQVKDLLKPISPMRQLANVITVGTPNYRKLVNKRGTGSGWVGEEDERDPTNTPQLAAVTPFWGELYANPQVTQHALDDLFFNVEAWLADEVATEFAFQEGNAFIRGDGSKKPKGFLAYATAATKDGTRAFGTLQFVNSGTAAAVDKPDRLISLVHALKAGHRAGASWLMNTLTAGTVRMLKDTTGQYLWRPGLELGQPNTLLGYAVHEAEDMPDIAANAFPVAFGNWKVGYTITDLVGVRVLRDPYTNKPYVGFYTTKRVGGMVEDSEAIKLLKVAADS